MVVEVGSFCVPLIVLELYVQTWLASNWAIPLPPSASIKGMLHCAQSKSHPKWSILFQ